MTIFVKIKNYLWRPFEFHSRHNPALIENKLFDHVIKKYGSFLPYSDGNLYGNISEGNFKISFAPPSAPYTRGAGSFTLKGKIEGDTNGSKIHGCLPGPAFAVCLLAVISFGFWVFNAVFLGICFFVPNHSMDELLHSLSVTFFLTVFTGIAFMFDRYSNRQGEEKILALFKEIVK